MTYECLRAGRIVTLGVLIGTTLTACATRSPAEKALRQSSREAATVCAEKFPNVAHWWDRWSGALTINIDPREFPRLSADQSGFAACVDAEIAARSPGPSGRLAPASAARTTVRVDETAGMILARVTVSGRFRGRFIVDTRAPLTLLTTGAARSLGFEPYLGVITTIQAPVPLHRLAPADHAGLAARG